MLLLSEMKKKHHIIGLLLIFLIIVGVFSWFYIKSTPQYSLYEMYKAVRAHDYAAFKKYADIDSIASNVIDKALAGAQKEQEKQTQNDPWAQMGANLAQSYLTAMKPNLIS